MSHLQKQPAALVKTNIAQGNYKSHFFDNTAFEISEVNFNSIFFDNNKINNRDDVELSLLRENFSFAYLREDKLRTIDAFDNRNKKIEFKEFLQKFGIKVSSGNLFKTGKYLSRVFRPVRYGAFYKELDVHINNNPKYSGAVTDGISLISHSLAKSLGWKNAEPNMSGQFTLFFKEGLVKGHCLVSDKIKSNVVIYGQDNIKKDIKLSGDLAYVSLEPVKLGESLRLDIQSLLNLWNLFGPDQYLEWAYEGVEEYKEILKSGRLSDWLDNFDEISVEDYNNESWLLRKAIWHKVNYTQYPGLVRLGWGMIRNSIFRYAESVDGNPVFRIPVPGGMRGYIRIDLRSHDELGDFELNRAKKELEVDKYGNVWLTALDIERRLKILGGADMDDSVGIIPVQGGKAVIYRNPNQIGEYLLSEIKFFEEVNENILAGTIPQKNIELTFTEKIAEEFNNKLYSNLFNKKSLNIFNTCLGIEYTSKNLLRTYNSISRNSANIGIAANAEMIKSAIGIEDNNLFMHLNSKYSWNLERIIDSTVKDGISSDEDMKAIVDMYDYIIKKKVKLPASIVHRLPGKLQENAVIKEGHLLDQLLEAIKMLIDKADKEIVGRGSVKKGNRIEGWIDRLDIPLIEIGMANLDNEFVKEAIILYKSYNKEVAILLENTKKLNHGERMAIIKERISEIQEKFLLKLNGYNKCERRSIILAIAYEIYKSSSAVHDSILWIGDKDGTAAIMLEILAELGEASRIKSNGKVSRDYCGPLQREISEIRLWSLEKLDLSVLSSVNEVLIENRSILIGDTLMNLGDECRLNDGLYSLLSLAPSYSQAKKAYHNNSFSACLI